MLTAQQGITCIRVCQMLCDLYQDIHLFRFDPIYQTIYILAGKTDEIEIEILPNGDWEFIQEEEE